MTSTPPKSKFVLRFSISALLVVTAAVAGFLGGRERGFSEGQNQWRTMPVSKRSYYVGDIIDTSTKADLNAHRRGPTLEQLANKIEEEVIPEDWAPRASDFIYLDHPHASLVVDGNSIFHAEIANYIAHLRAENDARDHGIAELFEDN